MWHHDALTLDSRVQHRCHRELLVYIPLLLYIMFPLLLTLPLAGGGGLLAEARAELGLLVMLDASGPPFTAVPGAASCTRG